MSSGPSRAPGPSQPPGPLKTPPESLPDLSLAMPAYNEEDVLRATASRLLRRFEEEGFALELVVVDNGSSDGTSAVIDAMIADGLRVRKAVVKQNIGYGKGALVGLAACTADWIGIIPADGQVDEGDVVRLFRVGSSEGKRVAKVRRRFRMDGLRRKVVSIIYNVLINLLFGRLGSIDINGSPKLFPKSVYKEMKLASTDWFLDAELMIKAKRLGVPVLEMNVLAQAREGGTSNVGASTITEFLGNLMRARFLGLPEASPESLPSAAEQPSQ